MIKEIYGKKIGMTQIFDEEGNVLPSTVLEVEPVYILEKVEYPSKAKAKIGCFKVDVRKINKIKKPIRGYFEKLGINPYKLIKEVDIEEGADFSFDVKSAEQVDVKQQEPPKTEASEPEAVKPEEDTTTEVAVKKEGDKTQEEEPQEEGQEKNEQEATSAEQVSEKEAKNPREIGVELFNEGDVVDVRAKSKGRGFAGGMKRHNWSGQPGSHGSTSHRRIGSAGASAYPSKIIKGLKMPGHMGNSFQTIRNLEVIKIDKEKNLIFIEGSVPGSRGTLVKVKKIK